MPRKRRPPGEELVRFNGGLPQNISNFIRENLNDSVGEYVRDLTIAHVSPMMSTGASSKQWVLDELEASRLRREGALVSIEEAIEAESVLEARLVEIEAGIAEDEVRVAEDRAVVEKLADDALADQVSRVNSDFVSSTVFRNEFRDAGSDVHLAELVKLLEAHPEFEGVDPDKLVELARKELWLPSSDSL